MRKSNQQNTNIKAKNNQYILYIYKDLAKNTGKKVVNKNNRRSKITKNISNVADFL